MRLIFTKRFTRRYNKLDSQTQKPIDIALTQLQKDFSHSSLRTKKIKGYRNPDIWEASATMDLRLTFEIQKPETIILRNCGHHDETLKNP